MQSTASKTEFLMQDHTYRMLLVFLNFHALEVLLRIITQRNHLHVFTDMSL